MISRGRMRGLLAAMHGQRVPHLIARAAEKYLGAYNNIFNWDMKTNGELRALRLALASFAGDVFDVGANNGQWATEVMPYLGGKHLHSFEPIPTIYAELVANIPPSPGVTLNGFGLSDAAVTMDLNFSAAATTLSSAYDLIYDTANQSRVVCAFRTGDDYVSERGIDAISLLKIDVEGMEMAVLEGFATTFAERRIASVQFEHGPSHILSGHFLKSFVDFFAPRGFDLYLIFPNQLVRIDYRLQDENFGGQNLLAVRRDLTLVDDRR